MTPEERLRVRSKPPMTACGRCGAGIWQVDMCYVTDLEEPCSGCQEVLRGESPIFGRPTVNREMGWCQCDDTDVVDRLMLAYLRSRAAASWPKPTPEGVSEDAALLLAYMADALEWTTHGGTVGGAWLTDAGVVALASLEQVVAQAAAEGEQE